MNTMSTGRVAAADLIAATLSDEVATLREARYVRTYWAIDPTQIPNDGGHTDHAVLTVEFDKHRGGYRATLTHALAAFDPFHREQLTYGTRATTLGVKALPAARFGAKVFAAFEQQARITLAAFAADVAELDA